MKVLVLDNVSEQALTVLRENGIEADSSPTLPQEELLEKIPSYEGMIVRSQTMVTPEVIAAGEKLKVIGRAGVGIDNVDLEAATQKGIIVLNAPDGNTIATAEHTVAMIMALSRNIPQAHSVVKSGQWDRKSFTGVEVCGKVLGLIGVGRIGSEVAKRMRAMGMTVLAVDPFLTEEKAKKLGVNLVELEKLLAEADYITVHTPLTPETSGLLNWEQLMKTKKGVRIINCARGGIVDEAALAEAIIAGQVAGAAIDVFKEEPPTNRRLIDLPQVVVTPHLGASTKEAQVHVAVDVAEEISHVLTGRTFKNAVNFPSVRPEEFPLLMPYFSLVEKLGILLERLTEGRIQRLEIEYTGEITRYDLGSLTSLVLKGLLQPYLNSEVNIINAAVLANQSGIKVSEKKVVGDSDYGNRIWVRAIAAEDHQEVAGSLVRRDNERIVEINGYDFDVIPKGNMLIAPHLDQPGIIGRVGSILGEAGINIAFMQVGRKEAGETAIMVLTIDHPASEGVLERISKIAGVQGVKQVRL